MYKISKIEAKVNRHYTKDGEVKTLNSITVYNEYGNSFIPHENEQYLLPNGKVGSLKDIEAYAKDKYGILN